MQSITNLTVAKYGTWQLLLALFFVLPSCRSKDEISTTSEADISNENLLKASIVDYSKKMDGCDFLIRIEGEDQLLQALKIPEEFKKDGIKVWISYVPNARPQGSCNIAAPISIKEIKIRN